MQTENEIKKNRMMFLRKMMPNTHLLKMLLLATIAVLAVWTLWGFALGLSGVDRGVYQAVFLSNGQVYFGKLRADSRDFLALKDAHFLLVGPSQESAADAVGSTPSLSLNILPLENQPHAPDSTMYISKEQVIFWENLKEDSAAMQVIRQQQEG